MVLDVGSANDIYGVDKNYDLGKYKADLDYDQGMYGINKNYSASIYGSNVSAQNAEASRQQKAQEAEAKNQEALQNEIDDITNNQVPAIAQQAIGQGMSLPEVIQAINESTYSEQAKEAGRQKAMQIFQPRQPGQGLTPYNMGSVIPSGFNSPIKPTLPKINYTPHMQEVIMSKLRLTLPGNTTRSNIMPQNNTPRLVLPNNGGTSNSGLKLRTVEDVREDKRNELIPKK